MKTILTTVLLMLLIGYAKAQKTVSLSSYTTDDLKPGNYIKDTNGILDPFVGIWKYQNGNEIFTVKIDKVIKTNLSDTNEYYQDKLLGGYKYEKNGVVLVDKLSFNYNIFDFNNFAILLGGIRSGSNLTNANLIGSDLINHKNVRISIDLISSNQIEWKLSGIENFRVVRASDPPTPPSIPGFGIPNNITLTKQ